MTILVSLESPSLQTNGLNRAEKSRWRVEAARGQRDAVVAWLGLKGYSGQFGDVSDATLFGTFTLAGTPGVYMALRQAPGVVNVVDVSAAPLQLMTGEAV